MAPRSCVLTTLVCATLNQQRMRTRLFVYVCLFIQHCFQSFVQREEAFAGSFVVRHFWLCVPTRARLLAQ